MEPLKDEFGNPIGTPVPADPQEDPMSMRTLQEVEGMDMVGDDETLPPIDDQMLPPVNIPATGSQYDLTKLDGVQTAEQFNSLTDAQKELFYLRHNEGVAMTPKGAADYILKRNEQRQAQNDPIYQRKLRIAEAQAIKAEREGRGEQFFANGWERYRDERTGEMRMRIVSGSPAESELRNQSQLASNNAKVLIDSLNQAMKLQLDEEQFESLAERQREIAERMESLQTENVDDAATERRMAEMEAEQEELRQQLQDLVQSIREHAEQLPNDEDNQGLKQSASDFANDLQESQAEPFMRGAQRSLLDSKFEQAAEQAASAAEELEALMKQGDRLGQEAQQNASKQFKPGRAGFDPKQALEQMKQKFGRGKSRGSQLGKGGGQGQGESEGDASTPQGNQRGGNSRRNTSPANTGLYGSNPKPSPSSQGRSDRMSQGAATSSAIAKQDQGKSSSPSVTESDAAGQGLQSIPLQYRSRVSDYMQRILEKPKSP